MKQYTREEVAKHDQDDDCWIIIKTGVYNVTEYLDVHPGSFVPIMKKAGQDATEEFVKKPHSNKAYEILEKFRIGEVKENVSKAPTPAKSEVSAKDRSANAKEEVQRKTDLKVRTKPIPWAEFTTHDRKESLWIMVDNKVYDVTNFKSHPGSFDKLWHNSGKDATKEFNIVGHKPASIEQMKQYYIGEIDVSTIENVDEVRPTQTGRLPYILMMIFAFAFFWSVGYFGA